MEDFEMNGLGNLPAPPLPRQEAGQASATGVLHGILDQAHSVLADIDKMAVDIEDRLFGRTTRPESATVNATKEAASGHFGLLRLQSDHLLARLYELHGQLSAIQRDL
jgi:hypothetical protein